MAVTVEKGSFAVNTGLGSQTVNLADGSLTPKAILFFGTRQSAGGYSAANGSLFFGAATRQGGTTQQWVQAYGADDAAVGASNTNRRLDTSACIHLFNDGSGGIDGEASLTSFGAGQFTINVDNTFAANYVVHYYAIGGTDITDAYAGTMGTGTGTGTVSTTAPGFTPSFVLACHGANAAIDTNAGSNAHYGFGLWDGTNTRQFTFASQDAQATTRVRSKQDSGFLYAFGSGADTEDFAASGSSFDATGFTINISNAVAAQFFFGYLALAGGQHKVFAKTTGTSITSYTETGVTTFTPVGFVGGSWNQTASASVNSSAGKFTIAAADVNSNGGVWHEDVDNVGTTQISWRNQLNKFMSISSADSTTLTEGSITSFSSTGYGGSWSSADGNAYEYFGWLIGSNAVTNTPRMALLGVG